MTSGGVLLCLLRPYTYVDPTNPLCQHTGAPWVRLARQLEVAEAAEIVQLIQVIADPRCKDGDEPCFFVHWWATSGGAKYDENDRFDIQFGSSDAE